MKARHRNGDPDDADRTARRVAAAAERRERASGKWSPWNSYSPDQIRAMHGLAVERSQLVPRSWAQQISRVYANGWMSVMVRTIEASSMKIPIDHAAIRTAMQAEPTWAELQRVKNELFGPQHTAVQIYPRTNDLIDEANMYHLWVFPVGFRFDFGLGPGQL